MHHVAIQQSEVCRGKFMAEISMYDPSMLIWLDETGCDGRNTIRKCGYSLRGMPISDHRLLVRGVRYSAIPVVSMEGIHDVYVTEGTVDGKRFSEFVRGSLLPILMPFNNINPRSVVIMDNASIHHVQEVSDLIETQAGARLHYLPPYSPDLNPAERGVQPNQVHNETESQTFSSMLCTQGNDSIYFWNGYHTRLHWTHFTLWLHIILM